MAKRLAEIGDGALEVALVAPGNAAIVVGDGEFRIEPHRLVEIGDRLVVLLEQVPGAAAIVEQARIGRVGLDAFVEVRDRALVLPPFGPRMAAIAERGGEQAAALGLALDDRVAAREPVVGRRGAAHAKFLGAIGLVGARLAMCRDERGRGHDRAGDQAGEAACRAGRRHRAILAGGKRLSRLVSRGRLPVHDAAEATTPAPEARASTVGFSGRRPAVCRAGTSWPLLPGEAPAPGPAAVAPVEPPAAVEAAPD